MPDQPSGEFFCSTCGYVLNEKIEDTGPERRALSKEEKDARAHTGPPASLAKHDMGLSSFIDARNTDASGKSLSSSMKATMERLRMWDRRRSRVYESLDQNRRRAFSELDRLAEKLNVNSSVIEKAAYIYRKAGEHWLIRGRSISGMIAGSLYAACRQSEMPRTLKDVSASSDLF